MLLYMWNNTHICQGFVGLAVCLVVWTPLFILTLGLMSISQIVQTTNRGWKEEQTNTELNLQLQEDEVGTFLAFYICLYGYQKKSYTATKDADSFGHHLHCSTFFVWLHWPVSGAWTVWLTALESHSWLTVSFILSSSLAGFHGHSS